MSTDYVQNRITRCDHCNRIKEEAKDTKDWKYYGVAIKNDIGGGMYQYHMDICPDCHPFLVAAIPGFFSRGMN
jgi:hypothetical protein